MAVDNQLAEARTDSFSARTTAVKAGNLAAALSSVAPFPTLVATSEKQKRPLPTLPQAPPQEGEGWSWKQHAEELW
jgi:hypothetical protein